MRARQSRWPRLRTAYARTMDLSRPVVGSRGRRRRPAQRHRSRQRRLRRGHRSTSPVTGRTTPKFAPATVRSCTATRLPRTPPADGRRRWITLDGIFYQADVWLDGAYLGDPEGYFFQPQLRRHVAVRASTTSTCSPSKSPARRRPAPRGVATSPASSSPDGIGSNRNPGGIWRPVHMYDTGPVRIDRLRVLCRDADARRAHLRIATRLDSDRLTAGHHAHASSTANRSTTSTSRSLRVETTSSGRSTSAIRRSGGHVRSAINR